MIELATMMGSYPKTAALKQGQVDSDVVALGFGDVEVAQKGFKDVVRRQKYDLAELAIMTFLIAFEHGKPYVLLPFVMNGGFHHKSLVVRDDAGFDVRGLAGRRVAMRSYSQTTPTWVRGLLADEYGIGLEQVQWLSSEGSHVEEYRDPPWVQPLAGTRSLEELLRAGEVDAIIAGGGLSGEPGIGPLIPEPAQAAHAWYERSGVVPINHMVALRREIADAHPEVVVELMRMLRQARAMSGQAVPADGPDLQPIGRENVDAAVEMAVRYAHAQGLISRRYALAELYGSVADALD